jgi:DsbC/DsbD-like thiol-disulfide interchange protein
VVSKYFEEDFRERYTSSDILIRQFAAGAVASTLTETKHLQLKTSASQSSARMGQRITLVMEVELKPGMHVYAPGVSGYIPIDWKIAESPAVKIHAVDYPKSEMLHLKAIQETVPVYRNRIRLVRDLTLGSDADVRAALNPSHDLVVAGTLRYQACDERICYLPENVPLTWTIHYEDLDRERVPVELRRKAPP